MVSTTLDQGLRSYGIGDKLRTLRREKKMGLVELGTQTGLSPAMLSKIERGRLFPTLPTLLRIALAFNLGLDFFFADERKRRVVAVVRRRDRQKFPERSGAKDVPYFFESLDFPAVERKLNAYYAEFNSLKSAKGRPHRHTGVEFIYLLQGKLALNIRDDEEVLSAGDAMYFDSGLPHSYRRAGKSPCKALVVIVP